jgi:hypothetical protein
MSTVIDQNLSGTNADGTYAGYDQAKGQSFTGNGMSLNQVVFKLNRYGNPTGNCYAKLYAHSGTFGSSSVPDTGQLLATSDPIDVSTITTDDNGAEYTFNFSNPYPVAAGAYYVIVFEYSAGGDVDNQIGSFYSNSDVHSGNLCYSVNGSSWSAIDYLDIYFKCISLGITILPAIMQHRRTQGMS